MLTKDMKKTLELFNKNDPDLQGRFFSIGFIAGKLDFDYMKALAVCESLEKEDYVAFGDKHKSAVRPLEKGINFKDLERQEKSAFWKDKVVSFVLGFISGVLVAIVTAVLLP